VRTSWTLLVLVALALSGCGAKPSAPTASDTPAITGGPAMAQGLPPPTWALGDYWTMDSPQGGTFSHVVSKDNGDDWILDTDEPNLAFFNARSDISFLGKVRKSDLAGSQGSTRVEFLQFPLAEHMNWTTTWDGQPTLIHVLSVQDGKATMKAMRATSNVAYADYTYDSKVGYFTHFGFYDAAGKAISFEWTLRQSGHGFSGNLLRWTLNEVVNITGAIPTGASSTTFTVPAGLTDLWIQATLDCTAGAVVIDVGAATGPTNDRGYSINAQCPVQDQSGYSISAPAADENWGAIATGAPGTTTGTIDLHLYERTLVTFTVGQAPA
jgi:hypothetical protein